MTGTIRWTTSSGSNGVPNSISDDAFKALSKADRGKRLGHHVCNKCEGWFPSQGLLTKHEQEVNHDSKG